MTVDNMPLGNEDTIDHGRAFELLPWLANETLTEDERERVERHVRGCLACRAELKEQRSLEALVRRHPTVHLSAEEGYERLRGALESPRSHRTRYGVARRRLASPSAMAAAVACAAVGAAAWLGWSAYRPAAAPRYVTVTDDSAASRLRIDVIFTDGTTETQMRSLLAELDAKIVGGPTDIGRYTLEIDSDDLTDPQLDALLRRLVADGRVRFAGRTFAPAAAAGDRP
jgi:hypothetical protein